MSYSPGVTHAECDAGRPRTSSSPGGLIPTLQIATGPSFRTALPRLLGGFAGPGSDNAESRRTKRQVTTDSIGSEEADSTQKPAAAEEEGSVTHVPVSTTSLGDFRRKPHTIYWPPSDPPDQQEWEGQYYRVHPDHHPPDAVKLLQTHTSYLRSGRRGNISCGYFKREESRDEHIAVKITNCRPRKRKEAMREFEQLRAIDHCHIIAALDVVEEKRGDYDLNLYLLLYPLAPYDLDRRLNTISEHNERRREDASVWRIHEGAPALLKYLGCLSQAVLYLHTLEHRIKHRDIKPANILIDAYGGVFLADFDISRQYKESQSSLTEGLTELTIDYAPGHVKDPKMRRDLEWDVISLGFVFVEILTVALGESRLDLVRFLARGNLNQPHKEGDSLKVNYAEALENGNLSKWLDRLGGIPDTFPERVPLPRVNGIRLMDIVLLIKHMIRSPPGSGLAATKRLDDAYACFSELTEPCGYCGPASGRHTRYSPADSLLPAGYPRAPPVFSHSPPLTQIEEHRTSTAFDDVEEDQRSSIRDQQSSHTSIDGYEAEVDNSQIHLADSLDREGHTAEPFLQNDSSLTSPATPRQRFSTESPRLLIKSTTVPVYTTSGASSDQGSSSSLRKTVTIREPDVRYDRGLGLKEEKELSDDERSVSTPAWLSLSDQRPNSESSKIREIPRERGWFIVISANEDHYDQMSFDTFRSLCGSHILEYTRSPVKPFFNLNTKRTEDFRNIGHTGVFYNIQNRTSALITYDRIILDIPRSLGIFRRFAAQIFQPARLLYYPCDKEVTEIILAGLPRRQMS